MVSWPESWLIGGSLEEACVQFGFLVIGGSEGIGGESGRIVKK